MKKNSLIFIFVVVHLLTGCISKENVELIVHNGKIYSTFSFEIHPVSKWKT